MHKRIISILLTLAFLLSLISALGVTVSAAKNAIVETGSIIRVPLFTDDGEKAE